MPSESGDGNLVCRRRLAGVLMWWLPPVSVSAHSFPKRLILLFTVPEKVAAGLRIAVFHLNRVIGQSLSPVIPEGMVPPRTAVLPGHPPFCLGGVGAHGSGLTATYSIIHLLLKCYYSPGGGHESKKTASAHRKSGYRNRDFYAKLRHLCRSGTYTGSS